MSQSYHRMKVAILSLATLCLMPQITGLTPGEETTGIKGPCGKGQYFKKEKRRCFSCPQGGFMDESSHWHLECKVCAKPDPRREQITKSDCTPGSNTELGCKEGWYDRDDNPLEPYCKLRRGKKVTDPTRSSEKEVSTAQTVEPFSQATGQVRGRSTTMALPVYTTPTTVQDRSDFEISGGLIVVICILLVVLVIGGFASTKLLIRCWKQGSKRRDRTSDQELNLLRSARNSFEK